jgi:hypothetical protein
VCHLEDFKVRGEWHFFATSHGKGPCDGIGGTLKGLREGPVCKARRISKLQRICLIGARKMSQTFNPSTSQHQKSKKMKNC